MEIKLTIVYGWWDWDAEIPALVNRVTGERVAFRGRYTDPDLVPSDESWLRFDYLHEELTVPLLVQEREAEPLRHTQDEGKTVWRIDYGRSNELWRRESGGRSLEASYGAWRRVDDCVTDAFAFWPAEYSVQGAFAREFRLSGGWLNGGWCKDVVRFMHHSPIREQEPSEYDYDPWLIPLDEAPPSPFIFHDHVPRRNGSENWEVENPVLLDGMSFEDPEHRWGLRLPPGTPLTGLEGRTAYLLAADGTRLLYPYYGDTEADRSGSHGSPSFFLLYADEIALARAMLSPGSQDREAFRADWSVYVGNSGFGIRQDHPESPFFLIADPTARPAAKMSIPTRPLWLRTRWGILDGWSQWPGSKAHSPAWNRLDLFSTRSLMTFSGYMGGTWSPAGARTVLASSSPDKDRH